MHIYLIDIHRHFRVKRKLSKPQTLLNSDYAENQFTKINHTKIRTKVYSSFFGKLKFIW